MLFAELIITGIVQGVGFRPFLYNLARKYELTGIIKNTGNLGVIMILQSNNDNFDYDDFGQQIKNNAPKISYIEDIKVQILEERDISQDIDFSMIKIAKSGDLVGKSLALPPDIAMCDRCLEDFNNPKLPRYYKYPFIACAQCGPRFTTMQSLPYDRHRSTMDEFPFCQGPNSCQSEYDDFEDRRFHAQTFGCGQCGPNYYLFDPDKIEENQNIPPFNPNDIEKVAKTILEGKIAAIKGIGGIFLVCNALDKEAVLRLREKKKDRKNKPFAIMVPNLDVAKNYGKFNEKVANNLTSFRRPIILVEKKDDTLPDIVSPGLPNIGIILPYTGVHYLLFEKIKNIPIVYTSGNISNLPMALTNKDIIFQLKDIADIFYLHNREIYQRCDDSVLRFVLNNPQLIRRSRGYVPEYIKLPFTPKYKSIIAVGPEQNSTGAISRGPRIFPTQHIGNINSLENYTFLYNAILHMKNLLKISDNDVGCVTHDLNPAFLSTKLAEEIKSDFEIPKSKILDFIPVQHHHAHLATLMVDHKLDPEEKIITIAIDGVGYGTDKQPWGGEILVGNYQSFTREAHLSAVPMVGSDLCAKYPGRMLICNVFSQGKYEDNLDRFEKLNNLLHIEKTFPHKEMEFKTVIRSFYTPDIITDMKSPKTTSYGRWLDSIASLFDVCQVRTYRGEPAMRLEGFIWDIKPKKYFDIDRYYSENNAEINSNKLFNDYVDLYINNLAEYSSIGAKKTLAASMVHDVSTMFALKSIKIAEENGIKKIGASGGVAYNEIIMKTIRDTIISQGYSFLQNKKIPCGDAGVSTGQIAVSANKE